MLQNDYKFSSYQSSRRIIDFGSAIDEFTLKHLYGSTGPSRYLDNLVSFWLLFSV